MLNERKKMAKFLIEVARKLEEDEEFLKELFTQESKGKTIVSKKEEMNIFEIYQTNGPEGLIAVLTPLDPKDVKKIVVDNGLDPAQKVRRWRKQEKIIQFVVEAVAKQMAKGGAFLK